ncbi:methylglyoxal reductase (NADPH-dependent) gre2 [Orbilia oligospora]|uniref:Methylglyoxal reductase (NADPH-dependent) gre2 n=1 Tax=Orbilia oligospora TaxID=2813651 RepID=A0A7C8NBC1_ORBOL|nr:methylglyoxal reductase (NADPH-dependent) gre2 [Orbilia oligospora]KAF3117796.1 methylglyoxal reductase (NADPH-dependent) gre2 [Orbilia oligospora]KAF3126456.1 methylglyoxal reductase (NADPH-dependent) gre2 [Orbilia oligospora]
MTTPPKGGLILVTGVTGEFNMPSYLIASWTALKLLEQGYKVRGTARTLSKAEFLKDGPFSKYASNFEIVEVADLEDNGAFNEAVKGVDGIAHIASPFHYRVTDPYVDLINPAVNGTVNLLKAAKEYAGPQLKRVVITSSFAAIVEPHKPGHAFDEAQWNQHSINLAESFKADPTNPSKQVPPNEAYRASKALAERALWDFVKTEKPSFEVAAINPVFVFGPVIHSVKDAESINTSVFLLYKFIAGLNAKVEEGVAPKAFVDVRDVADAHIKALQVEEAKGQRFFNVAGAFTWAEVVEILRKHNKLTKNDYPPTGEKVDSYFFNNTKSKDVLGLNYISLEDSVLATAESVERFL